MVEQYQPGAEESKIVPCFSESINVPLMARMNLSSVLLDPQIGESYTTQQRVQEEHLYSTGLWGGDKIKTIYDLQLELDDERAENEDSDDGRDDLSDENEEDMERYRAMAEKIGTGGASEDFHGNAGQMSFIEMQQIIESQKRQIKNLTAQNKQQEEEKDSIIESFKQSTSMLIERLKDLESNQTLGHERPQTACVLNNIRK